MEKIKNDSDLKLDGITDLINIELKKKSDNERIYTDEPIIRPASTLIPNMPNEYKRMRDIEKAKRSEHRSEEWLFYRQGKLMENFREDYEYDYEGSKEKKLYSYLYLTYQDLSDDELQKYFSWRTKYRDGLVKKASKTFAFLYIYELINLIGVTSAEEGYKMLVRFKETYAPLDQTLLPYLNIWINDFVVYYGLDPSLFDNNKYTKAHNRLAVLKSYEKHTDEEIFEAMAACSTYNIFNSKFYKEYQSDLCFVAAAVFRLTSELYKKARKRTYFVHLFGYPYISYYRMFEFAPFYRKNKHKNAVFDVDEFHRYICSDGIWSHEILPHSIHVRELGDMLRYIDMRMRKAYRYKTLLKERTVTKQLAKTVDEALTMLEKEKIRREKANIVIDLTKLQTIRDASQITREKLIVSDDTEDTEDSDEIFDECDKNESALLHMPQNPTKSAKSNTVKKPPESENENNDSGLTSGETEILRCLLEGKDANAAARKNGLTLSIAVDSINEKMFDKFGDTVILFDADIPIILQDYAEELKGLI